MPYRDFKSTVSYCCYVFMYTKASNNWMAKQDFTLNFTMGHKLLSLLQWVFGKSSIPFCIYELLYK